MAPTTSFPEVRPSISPKFGHGAGFLTLWLRAAPAHGRLRDVACTVRAAPACHRLAPAAVPGGQCVVTIKESRRTAASRPRRKSICHSSTNSRAPCRVEGVVSCQRQTITLGCSSCAVTDDKLDEYDVLLIPAGHGCSSCLCIWSSRMAFYV